MKKLVLTGLLACNPDDGTDASGQSREPIPGCEADRVDAIALNAVEMPSSPLGRTLEVDLDAASGAIVTCTLESAPPLLRQLVPLQATWRYLDTGQDPGPDWTQPSFDDSGWSSGPAPLGFGDEPYATTLAPGALAPPEVTWLRTTFTVDDPAAVEQLRIAARRDDGVVVYVNGEEVWRDNVPIAEPMYGFDSEDLFYALVEPSSGLLVAGENTLAVELRNEVGSGDAAFNLRLTAQVTDPQDVPEVHLVETQTPAKEHRLALYGLLPDATYACVARSATCGATAEVTVTTDPLDVVPELATHPDANTPSWGTYTLFNHQRPCADDHKNRLVMVDPDGRARWVYAVPMEGGSTIDIESTLLSPDEVLWAGGQQSEGSPQIVGLDGEVRYFTTYPGSEQDIYHHDVERTPDGRLLGIIDSNVDGSTHDWTGFSLIEHDPATGEVTWEWDSADAFARGELPPAAVDDYDPWHPNALASVDDAYGQGVYVSLLYTNEIIRIDRATGEIVWHVGRNGEFALVDPSGAPLPATEWFDHTHGINLYGDRLYVYDNGWDGAQSHAMAYRFDGDAKEAELAWSWTEFGWYEPNWGDVDELPSGDVLITMAHAYCQQATRDHPSALVEVDPATNEVVNRLDFLSVDDSTYRGERIDGCAVFANSRYCPEVAQRLQTLNLGD
jgi:hypothetical protein